MPELLEKQTAPSPALSTTDDTEDKRSVSLRNTTPSPSNTLPRCRKKRGKLTFNPNQILDSSSVSSNASNSNSAVSQQSSRSFIRACQRAKRVRFFRNGDQFFKGLWYAVTPDRIRTFESLLEDLTKALDDLVSLPHGVRSIFSIDGLKKVSSLTELEDGQSYVCSSNDICKKVDYENAREPVWNYGTIKKQSRVDEKGALSLDNTPVIAEPNDFVKPKIITVIRNGVKPRRIVRLLLNKRTAPSIHQVLSDITAAVKLDSGTVKKLYTIEGKEVTSLAQFFQDEDVFLAYGTERLCFDDFFLDTEEYKFLFSSVKSRPASVTRLVNATSNRSPKFARRMQPCADNATGISRPSPLVRKKFLNQRNQKKLRSRNKQTPSENLKSLKFSSLKNENGENFVLDREGSFGIPEEDPSSNEANTPSTPGNQDSCAQGGEWSVLSGPHPLEVSDRYKIGRLIGDGNFAVVHECVCKHTKNYMAMKIIDKSKCKGKELVDNEIALLRRVNHEHIVRLYDVLEAEDRFYLSMELIQGGDLFDALVSVRQYPENEAAYLMRSLCNALEYLHEISIVHRDVKPENLLLYSAPDGRNRLKLADFGLASKADELLYTVCGTPTYVAPEILAETGYGVKVDVWAAGVILYIMLCGYPPFISMQGSQEELFKLILTGNYTFLSPFWDNISSAAKGLIQGMLQLDTEDRYSAGEIVIHPWITGEGQVDAQFEEYSAIATQERSGYDINTCSSTKPSQSFYEDDSVEFYYSRRRSMDELSAPSQKDFLDEERQGSGSLPHSPI